MSTIVAPHSVITAEEFMEMPDPLDGSRQELVRGRIFTMPPPQGLHGIVCANILALLVPFVRAGRLGWVTSNDAGVILARNPDTVRGPDIGFWSIQRVPEPPAGWFDVAPDFVVEVVSPNDRYARVQQKVQQYLTSGVATIWVVDPDDRTVTVFRPGEPSQLVSETDSLDAGPALPGFTCRGVDIFV